MSETDSAWQIFIATSLGYPTVLFTGLVVLCGIYWLALLMGAADIDALDFDSSADSATTEGAAGLLMRFGLADLPNTVVISAVAIVGWLLSFLICSTFAAAIAAGAISAVVNTAILLLTLPLAARLAGWLLSPVRPLFQQMNREHNFELIGRTAVVRTGEVNADFGEATVDDGGAGLILKVRSDSGEQFVRGDRVVVIERLESGAYRVISEREFESP